MRDFDVASGTLHEARASNTKYAITLYRPTISAIKSCMKYSIAEMCISLFVITLFVNSAILIVAANSLGADAANADLPAIYRLFVQTIGQASGTYISNRSLYVSSPKLQSTSPDAHQEPSSPSPSFSPASPPG
jgi:metal iron transporter